MLYLAKTLILAAILATSCFAWKKQVHFITLPLIEGGGIFTSIKILKESNTIGSKIPVITTLSLLSVYAALGATAMFGKQDNYPILRVIHRSVGFAIFASAVWMSITASYDHDVKSYVKGIGYGYTALTSVPIIIFTF